MKVTKETNAMPSPPPACNSEPRLNSRGLPMEPAMSTDMRAIMATMQMQMRREEHCKPMIDQPRLWRTEGIVLESVRIGQYISDL